MILALHPRTDLLLGELTNKGDRVFWNDRRKQNINGEHTFEFSMLADSPSASLFDERSRFLVPARNGGFHEFVVYETVTYFADNEKVIFGIAPHAELDKQKIIPPQSFEAWTLQQFVDHVFPNTEWRVGTVEYSGIRSFTTEEYMGAYEFLQKVQSAFNQEFEMRFRTETNGNRITGRYVDFVQRLGSYTGKEVVARKDIIDMERKVYSDRIVTALFCVGPEPDEGGTRLTTLITDDDAFQRWNRNGNHIMETYSPESDDDEMTMERLTALGRAELERRISATIEYNITAAYLGHLFPYEDVNLGDTFRVKNTDMEPPLYATARAIEVIESISEPEVNTYTIGEVVEYREEDVLAAFYNMQIKHGANVIRSHTAPPGKKNTIWIKPGVAGGTDVAYTWDETLQEWVKITPTDASEIGAETPWGAQDKADAAKDEALGGAIDYTDTVVEEAKQQINQDVNEFVVDYAERKITQSTTAPSSPELDDLWIDISETPHVWKRWNGSEWVNASAVSLQDLRGKLDAAQLEVDSIDTEHLKDAAITAVKLGHEAVGMDNIQNGVITNAKLANLAVEAKNLASDSVTSTKIANLAVGNAAIQNGAITNAKIGSLDAGKITSGTIAADRIGANSITATHIASGEIEATHIKAYTITSTRIASDAIIARNIAANAITADHISANSITSNMITTAGLDAGVIKGGTITGVNINVDNDINIGNKLTMGSGLAGDKIIQFGNTGAAINNNGSTLMLSGSYVDIIAGYTMVRNRLTVTSSTASTSEVLAINSPNTTYVDIGSNSRAVRISPEGLGLFAFDSDYEDSELQGHVNGVRSTRLMWTNTGLRVLQATGSKTTAYAGISASAFHVNSKKETKKGIKSFDVPSLQLVRDTVVYEYEMVSPENENDEGRKHLGLIVEEAPEVICKNDTIDLYAMNTLLWKALQELSDVVDTLKPKPDNPNKGKGNNGN